MKKIILTALFIFSILSFNSCTYEDCNCPISPYVSSQDFTVLSGQWLRANDGNPYHWYIRLIAPYITDRAVQNGAVVVYEWDQQWNTWTALPYSTEGLGYEIWASYAAGSVDIDFVDISGNLTPPSDRVFKIVAIQQ